MGKKTGKVTNESDGEFSARKLNVKGEIINNNTSVGQRKNLSPQHGEGKRRNEFVAWHVA